MTDLSFPYTQPPPVPPRVVMDLGVAEALIEVAQYVSAGRGYVDVKPYPDALARRALGALQTEPEPPHQSPSIEVHAADDVDPPVGDSR